MSSKYTNPELEALLYKKDKTKEELDTLLDAGYSYDKIGRCSADAIYPNGIPNEAQMVKSLASKAGWDFTNTVLGELCDELENRYKGGICH